jgi:ferredoxin
MTSIALGAAAFAMMVVMAAVSAQEREPRAVRRAVMLALLLPLPYLAAGLVRFEYSTFVAAALVLVTGAAVLFVVVPTPRPRSPRPEIPNAKIDERDIMFSRRLLQPGTKRFEEYYAGHPEYRQFDDQFRAKPGLLAKGSKAYDPITFSAADANFEAVRQFHAIVDGEPASDRVECDAAEITAFIKEWALKIGAVSVGVTELREHHLYSHVGRGPDFGKPVDLAHRFAVALTVEMSKEMIESAPLGPTVMESAQQYLTSGAIAVQVADFIRRLGYPARAHIDGNYRVVCPLIARDAGLGEIGRMGLLMTPELGPRVRIAVVTTDLPLVVNDRNRDPSTIDFCRICKKCADVCPPRAISFDDRTEIDDVRRWQINQELCFTFWCTVGTDCARCVRVCPYSHPDNLLHDLVRAGVRNSSLFRRLALHMDNFFYGHKPAPSAPPDWLRVETKTTGRPS